MKRHICSINPYSKSYLSDLERVLLKFNKERQSNVQQDPPLLEIYKRIYKIDAMERIKLVSIQLRQLDKIKLRLILGGEQPFNQDEIISLKEILKGKRIDEAVEIMVCQENLCKFDWNLLEILEDVSIDQLHLNIKSSFGNVESILQFKIQVNQNLKITVTGEMPYALGKMIQWPDQVEIILNDRMENININNIIHSYEKFNFNFLSSIQGVRQLNISLQDNISDSSTIQQLEALSESISKLNGVHKLVINLRRVHLRSEKNCLDIKSYILSLQQSLQKELKELKENNPPQNQIKNEVNLKKKKRPTSNQQAAKLPRLPDQDQIQSQQTKLNNQFSYSNAKNSSLKLVDSNNLKSNSAERSFKDDQSKSEIENNSKDSDYKENSGSNDEQGDSKVIQKVQIYSGGGESKMKESLVRETQIRIDEKIRAKSIWWKQPKKFSTLNASNKLNQDGKTIIKKEEAFSIKPLDDKTYLNQQNNFNIINNQEDFEEEIEDCDQSHSLTLSYDSKDSIQTASIDISIVEDFLQQDTQDSNYSSPKKITEDLKKMEQSLLENFSLNNISDLTLEVYTYHLLLFNSLFRNPKVYDRLKLIIAPGEYQLNDKKVISLLGMESIVIVSFEIIKLPSIEKSMNNIKKIKAEEENEDCVIGNVCSQILKCRVTNCVIQLSSIKQEQLLDISSSIQQSKSLKYLSLKFYHTVEHNNLIIYNIVSSSISSLSFYINQHSANFFNELLLNLSPKHLKSICLFIQPLSQLHPKIFTLKFPFVSLTLNQSITPQQRMLIFQNPSYKILIYPTIRPSLFSNYFNSIQSQLLSMVLANKFQLNKLSQNISFNNLVLKK